jgi:hypothetical protein
MIYTAGPIDKIDRHMVGLGILMETMHRLKAGIYGGKVAPEHIIKSCWIEGGYNIDAPDTLPAGGCKWFQVDDEGGIAEQLTVDRET